MTEAVVLQSARPEHRAEVEVLLQQAGLSTMGLDSAYAQGWVALSGARVVGFLTADQVGEAALVRSLAIDPGWRRQGVAARLLARCKRDWRAQGVRQLWLLTETAVDWFTQQGFQQVTREELPVCWQSHPLVKSVCASSADVMHCRLLQWQVRPATEADQPAIADIFNHAVLHTAHTFEEVARDAEAQAAWWAARQASGEAVFVAEDEDGRILGWSALGRFRARPSYRYTGEHSVYLAPAAKGQGIGTPLLRAVMQAAQSMGWHTLIAVIALPNDPSVALHAAAGFEQCGWLREVGNKFGEWRDLMLMQVILPAEHSAA